MRCRQGEIAVNFHLDMMNVEIYRIRLVCGPRRVASQTRHGGSRVVVVVHHIEETLPVPPRLGRTVG
jgi:hypothetical protein